MSAGVSDQRMKGQGNQGYYGSTSGAQFQYPPFSVGDGTWSSTNDNLTILGGYATHDNYGGDGMNGSTIGHQTTFKYFPGNGDYNTWGSQQVGVAGVVGAAGAGVQQKKGLPYDDYYREQSGVYQSHDGIKNVEHGIQRLNLDMGSSMQQKQNLSNITNNNSNNTLSSSKTQSSETSSTQKEVVPKKMTWASIASQPAKPQISTTVNTVKKKGPGMPPPPMVPGKHNLDIGTWDSPSKNGSMMVPQPLPIILTPPVVPIQILPPTSKSNSNSQQSQNMGGNQSSANGGQRPSWPTPGQAHNQQLQQQSQQHQPQQPQQQHHHQQQSSHNNQGGGGGPSSSNQSQQSAHQQQQQHRQQNLGYNGPSHHMMNHNQQHQGNYHHSSTHHQQQYQHHHNNQHHSHHQGPPHHQQQQQQPHHPHHQPNHHYNNQHSNHNNQRDRGEMSQQHREPIKHQTQQHQQQQQLQQPPPPLPQPQAQAQHTSANIVTTNSDQLPSREQQKVAAASPLSDSDNLRDLSLYNPAVFDMEKTNLARFFVIKSYSEDDIHRSIKYEIWCSTEHGNNRLDQAYREREKVGGVIYLFFSVNGSGHFCGIAQMITPVDYNANSSVWAQDKWKGQFKVKWIYVKDVPNAQLRHIRLENNEGKSVTNSRDAQEVPNAQGLLVLHIIHTFAHTTSIFDDFTHYEKRQEEEVTRKYEPPQQLTAGLSNSYDKNNQRPFDGPSNNNSNNNGSTRDHHHSGYNSDRDKSNYHGGYNNNNDNKGYSGGGYKGGYGFDKQQSSYNNRGGGSGYQYDRRSGDSDGDHNQYRNDGRSPKDYHDGNSGSYHPRGGGGFRNNNRGGPTGGGSYYHRDNDTRRDYRDGGGRPNYHNRGGGSNNDGSNQHHENSRGGYNSARAGSSDDGSGHRDNHRERSEHSGRGRGGVYRNQN